MVGVPVAANEVEPSAKAAYAFCPINAWVVPRLTTHTSPDERMPTMLPVGMTRLASARKTVMRPC